MRRSLLASLAVPLLLPLAPPLAAAGDAVETAALRHAFVTSVTGTGDLSTWADSGGQDGIAGANHVCQARAEAAGLATAGAPEFRAWISVGATDAWCNVQGLTGKKFVLPACDGGTLVPSGPWVRTDGLLWANNLDQLTAGGPFLPAEIDEAGAAVAAPTRHFTGTGVTGLATALDCSAWSSAATTATLGDELSTVNWSSSGAAQTCANAQRLACLEVGTGVTVAKPRGPGYLVFATLASGNGDLSTWADAGGLAGADAGDAICRASAGRAGLPRPDGFRAWLSTGADDAGCRARGLTGTLAGGCDGGTPPPDGPYRRVDGFPLADDFADLVDGRLVTGVGVDELGEGLSRNVYTGTLASGVRSGQGTCGDWSDGTSGHTVQLGHVVQLLAGWTQSGSAICTPGLSLYCVGDTVVDFWDGFETNNFSRWSATSP